MPGIVLSGFSEFPHFNTTTFPWHRFSNILSSVNLLKVTELVPEPGWKLRCPRLHIPEPLTIASLSSRALNFGQGDLSTEPGGHQQSHQPRFGLHQQWCFPWPSALTRINGSAEILSRRGKRGGSLMNEFSGHVWKDPGILRASRKTLSWGWGAAEPVKNKNKNPQFDDLLFILGIVWLGYIMKKMSKSFQLSHVTYFSTPSRPPIPQHTCHALSTLQPFLVYIAFPPTGLAFLLQTPSPVLILGQTNWFLSDRKSVV